MIGRLRAAHAHRYELPLLSSPVRLPRRDVPMDPYALGLLLGDDRRAGSTTPSFTSGDPEHTLAPSGAVITVQSPVIGALRSLGLLDTTPSTKFVPEAYLDNSAEIRLAVLQGLLDSDGPVTRTGRTCRIQYTTASIQLRADVIALVRSLGGVAQGRPIHRGQNAHIIDIRLPEGVEPFRLSHRIAAYRAAGGGGRPMRFIDSIEREGRAQAVCIQVAAADSLYVTEDFLLTHNTLNDAFIILDEAQNTTPEQMKMFLTRLGFGSKIVVTGDITQIDLPSGTRSGLRVVREILSGIDDVHFATLTSHDVVRHRLVGRIVDAYDRWHALQDEAPADVPVRRPAN
jgi:phosphate starvation-inducible PhoH-like protein